MRSALREGFLFEGEGLMEEVADTDNDCIDERVVSPLGDSLAVTLVQPEAEAEPVTDAVTDFFAEAVYTCV